MPILSGDTVGLVSDLEKELVGLSGHWTGNLWVGCVCVCGGGGGGGGGGCNSVAKEIDRDGIEGTRDLCNAAPACIHFFLSLFNMN